MWDYDWFSSGYISGEYRILIKSSGIVQRVPAPSHVRCSDCSLEVDARFASTANHSYGIYFGLNQADDYYLFVVYDNGSFAILKWYNDEWHFLEGPTSSSAINLGQTPNHLRVDRRGSQITAYANGVYLASAQDSSLLGQGGVGLLAGSGDRTNVDARFDNFVVNR